MSWFDQRQKEEDKVSATLEEVNEARFSGREAEAVLRRDGTNRNWGKTSVES